MVSLPDSHVFELLARFPSSTYKIIEREVAPQNMPTTGVYNTNQSMRFNLSAAVNEFVLVNSSTLDVVISANITHVGATNFNDTRTSKLRPAWRPGMSWIGSIRESVNTNSLTTYELTDKNTINWYNCMRGALTRSPVTYVTGYGSINNRNGAPQAYAVIPPNDFYVGTPDADMLDIQRIARAGFCKRPLRNFGFKIAAPAGTDTIEGRDIGLVGGLALHQTPLTALGSMMQANSVIPLGLFSTYSGQSYGLEIRVAEPSQAVALGFKESGNIGYTPPTNIVVANPKIRLKILKILDETVMEAILQLYNKSESVEVVDNMKIPLSLQLSSFKYTFHQFSLKQGASEYQITVPTTAASLRGFAFRIVKSSLIDNISAEPEEDSSALPLSDNVEDNGQAIVYKFLVKVGSECIMESAVEQTSVNIFGGSDTYYINPCLNFFAEQAKKSGHLFSLLHHEKQAHDNSTGIEEFTMKTASPMLINTLNESGPPGYMYSMNFENVNHFENNNQASGIDCRNYGSYTVTMKVGVLKPSTVNPDTNDGTNFGELVNLPVDYTVLLMNCEDVVYEVSRSGVADITSSVL